MCRSHQGVVPQSKQGRSPRERRQPRRSWEDVGQVCQTLLLHMGDRYPPPADVLGSDGVNPERRGGSWGIRLLEPIWKVLERVMDFWLENISLHYSLHACLAEQGTGMRIIEATLAQQLAHLEQEPIFGVFVNLKKAFDAMDQGRYLAILALHGVGPQMLRLIHNFWEMATNICRAKGNASRPYKAGHGVTKGGPCWQNCLTSSLMRWSASG